MLQNKGYVVWFGKYGLFGYNRSGTAFGKDYCKSYVWMMYKDKSGVPRAQYKDLSPKDLSMKKPGSLFEIRLQPEWIDGLIKLLIQLREDLMPGGKVEDIQEEMSQEQEQSEIDELMAKVGFKQPSGDNLGKELPGMKRREL